MCICAGVLYINSSNNYYALNMHVINDPSCKLSMIVSLFPAYPLKFFSNICSH